MRGTNHRVGAGGADQGRYIVVLNGGPSSPANVAADVARRSNGRVGYVYANALRGFSITIPRAALAGVARNPHVAYEEEDRPVGIVAQTLPTGVDRVFQPETNNLPAPTGSDTDIDSFLSINGVDDWRVDVDVAVLDTGIDLDHPELNVVGGTNCMQSTGSGPPWKRSYYCDDTEDADDDHYHGTHVAGTIGAVDNGVGVVGVAPGARLYAVKVLDSNAEGWASSTLAGIDWVVAQGDIEVMNMSLGGSGQNLSYVTAIDKAVAAGVVVVVAASNSDADANDYSPAFVPSAITVSALADFNGLEGGQGSSTCSNDQDDTLWDLSNWGSAIDIAAPGVCILSTIPLEQGEYGTLTGTSMATPHVAGAAALLASGTNSSPENAADVHEIRDALVDTGNYDWVDDSGDGFQEPLLDVSTLLDDPTFTPKFVPGDGGNGGTNDLPTAHFTTDDCVAGQSCSFDGSSSYDNDGTIDFHEWDFDGNNSTDTTGATASYAFTLSGAYTVTLTVTDNEGATDSETQTVSVSPDGSGTPDACDGLGEGVHLTPSSTNQGSTWTAIVDAVNCIGEDVASFDSVSLSWSPEVGTVTDDCSTSTGACQATQSGIRKKTGSVQFTLNGAITMVSKP